MIRLSRDHVQCKNRQPMDGGAKKLRRIGHFEKIGFQITTFGKGSDEKGSAILCFVVSLLIIRCTIPWLSLTDL